MAPFSTQVRRNSFTDQFDVAHRSIILFFVFKAPDLFLSTPSCCFVLFCACTGRPPVSFAALGSPFGSESLGQVFEIASVREGFGVELVWSLPCLSPEYADKTADFLGNVIGHEGQGTRILLLIGACLMWPESKHGMIVSSWFD